MYEMDFTRVPFGHGTGNIALYLTMVTFEVANFLEDSLLKITI